MKIKKKFGILMSLVLIISIMTACKDNTQSLDNIKQSGKIVMYTNAAFPPFEYINADNGISGADIDIANEIAKDIGVEIEILNVEFTSALAAIQSGKGAFSAAGMTVNEEREKVMDFSIKYAKSTPYVILPKSDNSIVVIEDLAGKRIGTQEGTTGDIIIKDEISGLDEKNGTHTKGVLEDTGAECISYSNVMNAAQDITSGRLDAVIIDKLPAESIALSNKDLKCIELKYTDGRDLSEEYAIAVQKGNSSLLEQINKTLKRLIDEGKIEEYVLKHSQ